MVNIVAPCWKLCQVKTVCGLWMKVLESRQLMTAKDERIGFRVSSEIKVALLQIAKKEGRSLAQICELLLRGGIHEYQREGSRYLHRFVERPKEKDK
jgi:hypothetical protein